MDYYLGEIRMFAGVIPPTDWVLCNGQMLSINAYPALYALLGTTWGGDSTSFGVPDLRGRLPIGQGDGPTTSNRILGQKMGVETVALTEANLPPHSHSLNGTTTAATTVTPGPTVVHAALAGNARGYYAPTGTITDLFLDDLTIGEIGGSQAHPNLMPARAVNFMMATNGLYPVQN